MTFRIVVSQPGCLPEGDPYDVDSQEEAIDALMNELEVTDADIFDIHKSGEKYMEVKKEILALSSSGVSVTYGGYVHEAIPISE